MRRFAVGMMGYSAGASSGGGTWLLIVVLVLVAVVLLARALPTMYGTGGGTLSRRRAAPEELLGERYARGEIGWPEYREGLVSLLKERYVRGEIEVDDYEARVVRLLEEKPNPVAVEQPRSSYSAVATTAPAVGSSLDDRGCGTPLPRAPRRGGCC